MSAYPTTSASPAREVLPPWRALEPATLPGTPAPVNPPARPMAPPASRAPAGREHGPVERAAGAAGSAGEPARASGPARLAALIAVAVALVVATPMVRDLTERSIDSVRVTGEFRHLSAAVLRGAIAPALEAGFFEIDVAAVRAAATALPWVRDATVRRVWPGSVHVAIVERMPVARWNQRALLEADATVFVPGPGPRGETGLAWLLGPVGTQPDVLERHRTLDAMLAPVAGARIARLELTERGRWNATLANGVELVIGPGQPNTVVERFVDAVLGPLGGAFERMDRVDLRHNGGFAVRWRPVERVEDRG